MMCEKCGIEHDGSFGSGRFCSRACANSRIQTEEANLQRKNKLTKRVRGKCLSCGDDVFGCDSSYCRACYSLIKREKTINTEISSLFLTESKSRHRFQSIREYAKREMKINKIEKKCIICGYTNHVEVCHIKPISEFSISSTLGDVNNVDNLVYLCPNHHWELDNDIIKI